MFWMVLGISVWDLGGALCIVGFGRVDFIGLLRNGVKV